MYCDDDFSFVFCCAFSLFCVLHVSCGQTSHEQIHERLLLLAEVLRRLRPGGVVVIPLATVEALAELRPLLEQAGWRVAVSQLQAWRGAPLAEGTRLQPLNPVLVLRGRHPGALN